MSPVVSTASTPVGEKTHGRLTRTALFLGLMTIVALAAPSYAAEIPRPRLTLETEATQYPTESLANAEEGTAIVELAIAVDGSVTEATLLQSAGHPRLDDASVIVARRMKLSTPPMRNGVPTAARVPAAIVWKLPLLPATKYMPADLIGGTTIQPGDIVRPPRPLPGNRGTQADYPRLSLQNDEAGRVTLFGLIGPDGAIADARIAGSSGFKRLDDAALKLVQRFRYEPATLNGIPASVWAIQNISFKFQGEEIHNCYGTAAITAFQRRQREAPGEEIPRYERWTLIDEKGEIEESLILTTRGWMSLSPPLLAVMREAAGRFPVRGRPARCWVYDGVDPMMDG